MIHVAAWGGDLLLTVVDGDPRPPGQRRPQPMTTLLRVDASFRTQGSTSRELADSATAAWLADKPHGTVVRGDLAASPPPADAWAQSVAAAYVPEEHRSPEMAVAQRLAGVLADEIIAADVLVLASPLFSWPASSVETAT